MSIRIRVYPQYGFGAYGGYGRRRYRTPAEMELRAQRQRASMQLRYERALFAMQLQNVQVQTAAQYGGYGSYGSYGGYAAPAYAAYGAALQGYGMSTGMPFMGYRYASVSPFGISMLGY